MRPGSTRGAGGRRKRNPSRARGRAGFGSEQQLEVGANLEQLPADERRVARRASDDVGALGRAEHEVRQRVEIDVEARGERSTTSSSLARKRSRQARIEASMTSIAPSTPS